MKKPVALAVALLCALTATALEWGFKETGECRRVVPDEPAFARAGTYVLQLAVSDGLRTTYSDPLTVEVPEAGTAISFR